MLVQLDAKESSMQMPGAVKFHRTLKKPTQNYSVSIRNKTPITPYPTSEASSLHPLRCLVSQYVLQYLLLVCSQAGRELDLHGDDEVASFVWLLALRHSQPRETFRPCRLRRARPVDLDLLAIDGLDRSRPAGECFFEVDVYGVGQVIAFTFEERVIFL